MIAILVPTSIPTCVPIPRFHRPCFKDSPMTGKSLSKSVVYQADVTTDDNGAETKHLHWHHNKPVQREMTEIQKPREIISTQ